MTEISDVSKRLLNPAELPILTFGQTSRASEFEVDATPPVLLSKSGPSPLHRNKKPTPSLVTSVMPSAQAAAVLSQTLPAQSSTKQRQLETSPRAVGLPGVDVLASLHSPSHARNLGVGHNIAVSRDVHAFYKSGLICILDHIEAATQQNLSLLHLKVLHLLEVNLTRDDELALLKACNPQAIASGPTEFTGPLAWMNDHLLNHRRALDQSFQISMEDFQSRFADAVDEGRHRTTSEFQRIIKALDCENAALRSKTDQLRRTAETNASLLALNDAHLQSCL